MKKRNKHILSICIMTSIMLTNTMRGVSAVENDDLIKPQKASYGYYVDVYKNNTLDNLTVETNPSIALLSSFLEFWTPGTEWNNGVKINSSILDKNIRNSKEIVLSRTAIDEKKAYLDDRRNQSYSTISGLGPYTDEFKRGSNAETTIPDEIPSDANINLYSDEGNNNEAWADEASTYGSIVKLTNTLHGGGTSTSSAKKYYKYMRPFRWTDESLVESALKPAIKKDPSSDGGYPSGHTNSSYLAAYALAYAVPERYDELITRASELGNNRIVCGMHSCMDVMGGRILSTALAASILNDPANEELKKQAINDGQNLIAKQTSNIDDYSDYKTNKEKYIKRLTYGFEQIGYTSKPMVVPKGAEVLIESRFPYLDANERRYVLYTTGLPSGYPLLDDEEGWGRLNLFEAANGYKSFVKDINVDMDKSKGGFNSEDEWKNDIDGEGSLTKEGTGKLILSGNNSYKGGTKINNGTIAVDSAKALGDGNVINNSTLIEYYNGNININGTYNQDDNAVLELNISSSNDFLKILKQANLKGKLKINFTDGFLPNDDLNIISYGNNSSVNFSDVEINGLSETSNMEIVYTDNCVKLVNKDNISTSENKEVDNNANLNNNENPNNNNVVDKEVSINEDNIKSNTVKTEDNNIIIIYIIIIMLLGAFNFKTLIKKYR